MNFLILGLPNVGKTSFYNILTDNNENIIHQTVGTTRDWHVGNIKNYNNINVYDTPGILSNNTSLINKKLIKEIDIILYVIDFRINNFHQDKELLNYVRKFGKEIILIINKDDNFEKNKDLNLFGLKNIFYVSCSHKLGIDEFISYIKNYDINFKKILESHYSIGLFGKTNVGKSTLLNKLVGYQRSTVSDKPKTTTDVVSSFFKHKNCEYSIKDTAGLIKKNKIDRNSLDYYATKKTLSIIKDIDINIFLIDVQQGFDSQSKKIFNIIYNKSNVLLFLINKIDLIKNNKKEILSKIKNDIRIEFSESKNIKILPISSLENKDILNLKNYINKITKDINLKFSTSKINRWLSETTAKNPHSRIKGKEVKFKYATQIGENPMKIKIFSNFSKEISINYRRFLINEFYKSFNIKNKKAFITISKINNPYN